MEQAPKSVDAEAISPGGWRELYEELRHQALTAAPESAGDAGKVVGACMEFTVADSEVGDIDTFLYCALGGDGEVQIGWYTSYRCSLLAERFPDDVVAAARTFLAAAQPVAPDMTPTIDFPSPSPGTTRLFTLTRAGVRTAEFSPGPFWRRGRFARMAAAGHKVIQGLSKIPIPDKSTR